MCAITRTHTWQTTPRMRHPDDVPGWDSCGGWRTRRFLMCAITRTHTWQTTPRMRHPDDVPGWDSCGGWRTRRFLMCAITRTHTWQTTPRMRHPGRDKTAITRNAYMANEAPYAPPDKAAGHRPALQRES